MSRRALVTVGLAVLLSIIGYITAGVLLVQWATSPILEPPAHSHHGNVRG